MSNSCEAPSCIDHEITTIRNSVAGFSAEQREFLISADLLAAGPPSFHREAASNERPSMSLDASRSTSFASPDYHTTKYTDKNGQNIVQRRKGANQ
jgi:hypothetical protein